jgi:arylsulfatase A
MINKKIFLTGAVAVSISLSYGASEFDAPPNIILIMADDIGYECFGANGSTLYETPNIDRLADEGIRFTRCHVNPICTPTRVELMTGLYNVRNYEQFGVLPRTERTFGNVFKDAGYATAIFGKWQLGTEKDAPQYFGFDESFLWQHTRAGGPDRTSRYKDPGLEINGEEYDFPGEYGPKLVNEFALDFITRNREKPFLLYYPMIEPHGPFNATPDCPDWNKGIKRRSGSVSSEDDDEDHADPDELTMIRFRALVKYMDKMVGNVMDKLVELDIDNNTVVIFLGDNGTNSNIVSKFNGINYQGGKGKTSANGTHVPLFVRWPGKIFPNRVCDDLVGASDFYPTICEIAKITFPDNLDGISFMPALIDQEGPSREWIYGWFSTRKNPVKLSIDEYVHDGVYKLYRSGEIYNVITDPFEKKSLNSAMLSPDGLEHFNNLKLVLEKFKYARPIELEEEALKRANLSKEK